MTRKQRHPRLVRLVWRALGIAFVAASLVFVGVFFHRALQSSYQLAQVDWLLFGAAMLVHLLVLLTLPPLWARLLSFTSGEAGGRISHLPLYLAFTRSWLGRYLPGRLWAFGGRALLAKRQGTSGAAIGSSMLLETYFSYGSLAVLGVVLTATALYGLIVGALVLAAGGAALVVALPFAQRFMLAESPSSRYWQPLRMTLARLTSNRQHIRYSDTVRWVALYGLHSMVQVGFFALLAISLLDLTGGQLIAAAGAWVLGAIAGFLVVFVPVGIGVREGATFLLLSQTVGSTEAGVIVAANRIALVLVDVVFVVLLEAVALVLRFARRRVAQPPNNYAQEHV